MLGQLGLGLERPVGRGTRRSGKSPGRRTHPPPTCGAVSAPRTRLAHTGIRTPSSIKSRGLARPFSPKPAFVSTSSLSPRVLRSEPTPKSPNPKSPTVPNPRQIQPSLDFPPNLRSPPPRGFRRVVSHRTNSNPAAVLELQAGRGRPGARFRRAAACSNPPVSAWMVARTAWPKERSNPSSGSGSATPARCSTE
jgi:hypothetical protein